MKIDATSSDTSHTSATPLLIMHGVSKRFGATAALEAVELKVAAGSVHALVGENGAGKSTLMKVLSGALAPEAGEMWLDGRLFRPRSPLDARRAGVAMIYQELALAPHLSVADNILLGVEPAVAGFIRRGEMRARAREALDMLRHPEIHPDAPVSSLSAAARQLVEIARAVAVGCRVLVLDEPTSSLAQDDVTHLFELIARLKAQGRAIIYISHFLDEVRRVADHITVLRDGRVAGSAPAAILTNAQVVALMVGRQVDDLYPRSIRAPGEVVLEVTHLAGHARPVDANLQLRRGEVLGIAGLVGAGRTELLRALFGLEPVRRGQIRLGVHLGLASPARRLAQGAGLLSEDRKAEGLALGLTITDNLTLSRLGALVSPQRQQTAARRWIEALQIRCRDPRQRVADLSGGNQQKVALARLLHHDVDVLLLDEPTRGIDVASKAQIYRFIDALATGANGRPPKAILMVSSYLPELLGICDRIAVMHRGILGPACPVSEVTAEAIMLEAAGAESVTR